MWESDTEQELRTLETSHRGSIVWVAFSPDKKRVASGDLAGDVRCWDVASGHEICATHRPDKVYAVEFSPDGKALAYAGEEKTIGFLQTENN